MKKELFESFLSSHEQRIYRYLIGLTANEHDAMDLVQAVFISVYEHFERIEEPTALSYVYRIAHNKAMTFLKQKSRYITLDTEKFKNLPQPSPPEEPDYSDLHTAISGLPPRLAAVIQLQYFEKMSYKEISETLGISVKAVESLLVRAKRILRKKIMQERKDKGVV
ncbi:MAG: RNA polymerase sigma factor [Candidatus Cloacimonetes bacterium]|jgi:RNA polymerase sigma-70 factor (ECF subfamily)|nr:RNA polymerase sigma factor [Candidatus Cloacimonadota bacterium]MDY0336414.1 RNA polymerase sigma factor [Candidatus Cloacimonadaceae bacterium]MCB5269514.1 RNA polymerase sigma factor [Candidatus Cloacimonadota bacterium]MCK9334543.1 RNA polymerase sigma factor [Candidatus Cloacimonadota bacterium]MDD2543807.1 RNA polymerase sigma factor [Candidatus Cloacimonadota bacterium]